MLDSYGTQAPLDYFIKGRPGGTPLVGDWAGATYYALKNASGNVVDLGAFGFQIDNNAAGSETGCINMKPGFRATAGTAGTTFHGWVQTVPAAVSVAPASGSGLSQTFTWTASSPAGYVNLMEIYGRFGTPAYEGVNTCYIRYDRVNSLLWLAGGGRAGAGIRSPGTPRCELLRV